MDITMLSLTNSNQFFSQVVDFFIFSLSNHHHHHQYLFSYCYQSMKNEYNSWFYFNVYINSISNFAIAHFINIIIVIIVLSNDFLTKKKKRKGREMCKVLILIHIIIDQQRFCHDS